MDQLAIFLKTAYYSDTDELQKTDSVFALESYSGISENRFLRLARERYESYSDDTLRLIHRNYESSWGKPVTGNRPDILMPIVRASGDLIETRGGVTAVKYEKMFHWRELTRFLGEDIFITARLANDNLYSGRDSLYYTPDLDYEPGLRNNDVHLRDLFETENIYELHCHLNATAKVFDISWSCLMNHPSGRITEFRKLAKSTGYGEKDASGLQEIVGTAAMLRVWLYKASRNRITTDDVKELTEFLWNPIPTKLSDLERHIAALRNPVTETSDEFRPDYICPAEYGKESGDFRVYIGEREFLYRCWCMLLRTRNSLMEGAFRYYLLAKSLVRRHMVQLNNNHGFSNFQRYENVKSIFLQRWPGYLRMLSSLAVAGAVRDSGLKGMEVRITPEPTPGRLNKKLKYTEKFIKEGEESLTDGKETEHSFIYHFIKKRDNSRIESGDKNVLPSSPRNINVRRDVRKQAQAIARLHAPKVDFFETENPIQVKAIDAASSEFNCRPEVFAQAFRFLKGNGFKATYHAGEDFYDIADGLRAIDEAITFLGLSSGDRLGHALALGIDADRFYAKCSNHVVVKSQWFLDNIVWLHCRARDWNISIEPETERWFEKEYRRLFYEIFCASDPESDLSATDMETYHQSMMLRGDNPSYYNDEDSIDPEMLYTKEDWNRYALSPHKHLRILRQNKDVRKLYMLYHFDRNVRLKGREVKDFKICPGYSRLITEMQEKLMDRVEKHDLCIECCPSSNLVIGSLGRFENHPIFRFHNINPTEGRHLAVTINTDDSGVFHTTLFNEYSYLALALTKQKDGTGHRFNQPRMIAEWLKTIAAFSRKYRFRE